MPELLAPLGAVNGLLLRLIKMELKINSPFQHTVVMAQPRATAIVPGLPPGRNWIGVEMEGEHCPVSGGTQLCGLWLPSPCGHHHLGTIPCSP